MCNFADLTGNTTHTIVVFVSQVERCSIPRDLSHGTKISANTYDTLRDLLHATKSHSVYPP